MTCFNYPSLKVKKAKVLTVLQLRNSPFQIKSLLGFSHCTQTQVIIFLNPAFKRVAHRKMKILSSFTHPHVIPKLHDFIYFVQHKND